LEDILQSVVGAATEAAGREIRRNTGINKADAEFRREAGQEDMPEKISEERAKRQEKVDDAYAKFEEKIGEENRRFDEKRDEILSQERGD